MSDEKQQALFTKWADDEYGPTMPPKFLPQTERYESYWKCWQAALASQPKPAPVPKVESSPTAGMTLGQRILHVGGRNNAAGYVEFGSTQAVGALVRQVLRDLPKPEPIPEHELVTMYAEMPRSDSEMIEFARAIESAAHRKNGWGV